MTVIEMAREAGFEVVGDLYGEDALIAKITRLVELEREACALICDSHADDPVYCGELIRARGQA